MSNIDTKTVRVTICGPNLNDQSKGTFHIHAADCADLTRGLSREPEYAHGWTIEAGSRDDVGDDIYKDHIAEGSTEPGEGKYDCHFFPCCAKALDAAEKANADSTTEPTPAATLQYEVTNKTTGTHFPIGVADNYDDARGMIGLELKKCYAHLDDFTELLTESTKPLSSMEPGDYSEFGIGDYTFAVKVTEREAPTFDRDAYAEALETLDNALEAFRDARSAVEVLRTAAEQFDVKPFADIVTNYGLIASATPVFDQLESIVSDGRCYYPVSHRAKRIEELAAKHDIELPTK